MAILNFIKIEKDMLKRNKLIANRIRSKNMADETWELDKKALARFDEAKEESGVSRGALIEIAILYMIKRIKEGAEYEIRPVVDKARKRVSVSYYCMEQIWAAEEMFKIKKSQLVHAAMRYFLANKEEVYDWAGIIVDVKKELERLVKAGKINLEGTHIEL